MASMSRRVFLIIGLKGVTFGIAGCIEGSAEGNRVAETPVRLEIGNDTEDDRLLQLTIHRDGEELLSDSFELEPGDHISPEKAFDLPGEYSVSATTENMETTLIEEVTWDDLEDCNSRWFTILVSSEEIVVHLMQTLQGCPD